MVFESTVCFQGCTEVLFSSVALFEPDGQRLRVQADQQLHQLFHAWRPKGTWNSHKKHLLHIRLCYKCVFDKGGFEYYIIMLLICDFCHFFIQTLFEFRFEFLRVVCYHEHYVPLNLPMPFGKGRIMRFQGKTIIRLTSPSSTEPDCTVNRFSADVALFLDSTESTFFPFCVPQLALLSPNDAVEPCDALVGRFRGALLACRLKGRQWYNQSTMNMSGKEICSKSLCQSPKFPFCRILIDVAWFYIHLFQVALQTDCTVCGLWRCVF